MASVLLDSELITSIHRNPDTECQCVVNHLLRVPTGPVEDSELEVITLAVTEIQLVIDDSKGTEATCGKLLNIAFEEVLNLVGLLACAESNTPVIPLMTRLKLPVDCPR